MNKKDYGYISHIVKFGDSIQKIAFSYGVEDWREIIYFNNLEYPYINSESYNESDNPNVANIGSVIYIPSYNYGVAPIAKESITDETMIEQAYGCDLDLYTSIDDNGKAKNLDTKGQLLNSDHDLMLAKGIDNLKQQITTKLSTKKGTIILHPEWGCDILDMVGTKGTQENLIDMMLMVKEALLEDFRIVEVNNLKVEKGSDYIVISCSILPISPYPEFEYNETIK